MPHRFGSLTIPDVLSVVAWYWRMIHSIALREPS